jgi:hypothetical protein
MTPIISKILELIDDGYNMAYVARTLHLPIEFVSYAYNKYRDA